MPYLRPKPENRKRYKLKLKTAWTGQLFESVNVSRLTGYLRTAILAETI